MESPDLRTTWLTLTRIRLTVTLLFAIAFVVRAGYWVLRGSRQSADTSGFISTCAAWTDAPLAVLGSYRGLLFSGFTVPFCMVQALTGGSPDAWVLLQLVLSSLTVVLVFDTARRLAGYQAGIVAGLGMAGLFDAFQWSIYLLSDTTFVFAVALALWSVVRYRAGEGRSVTPLLALGFLAVVRPFGLPLTIAFLATDSLPVRHGRYRLGLLPRAMALAIGVAGTLGVILFLASLDLAFFSDYVLRYYAAGVIVHDDPTFAYPYKLRPVGPPLGFAISNAHHLLAITLLRALAFFLPVAARFSLPHNVLNLLTLGPLLVGGAAGVAGLFRDRSSHVLVLLLPVLILTGVVAVTWVDFDWRYRAPLGPVLAILTSLAVGRSRRIDAAAIALSRWRTHFERSPQTD